MTHPRRYFNLAYPSLALSLCLAPFARAGQDTGLDKVVRPFFSEHCDRCHGEKKQKGDLRLDTLAVDFDSPKVMGNWMEVMSRINTGEMPPEKEPRPKADDVAHVSEWITSQLLEAEAAQQAGSKDKVVFYKLSREEYANTIRDLLGVTYDATDPTGLPEDPDWHGFQRIGSVLTLSAAHVEKYYASAEMALAEALPAGPAPKRDVTRWNAFDIRGWKSFEKEFQSRGIADKVRVDLVPNNGALDVRDINIKTAGDYVVRVKLSGLRPANGRPPRLRLYAGDISRVLFERDIEAPEDQPTTIEFKTHLPVGNHSIRIVNAVPAPTPRPAARGRAARRRRSPVLSRACRGRSNSPMTTASPSSRSSCSTRSSGTALWSSRGRRRRTSGFSLAAPRRTRTARTPATSSAASPNGRSATRCRRMKSSA